MALFKNASPQVIFLGTDDQSTRTILPTPEPIPQHCPIFYIMAKKGPTGRMLLSQSKLTSIYGSETFDLNDKFYNHQTRFLQAVSSKSNNCMIQRLVPKDALVKANAVIYADVLETQVPNYVRNSAGEYVLDEKTNKYKVNTKKPTIKGYEIKFIKETLSENSKPGLIKAKDGTMSTTISTEQVIPNAYDLIIKNIKNKIKVGDVLPIYDLGITQNGKINFSISSSNKKVAGLDPDTLKWVAKEAGTTKISIVLEPLDPKATDNLETSKVEFDLQVVDTDVNDIPNITLTGVKNILTPEDKTMSLSVTGDGSDTAVISVKDAKIASVNRRVITGLTNGVTYVTVNVPATADKEGVSFVFTLQSKVAKLPNIETQVKSKMYPLFELEAKYPGEYYNNIGFSITSLQGDSADSKIISKNKALPYKLALYTRPVANGSPVVLRSLYSEPSVQFTFKERDTNPNTEARFDFETVYKENWFNEDDELKPMKYFEYEHFYFYRENLETITKLITKEEEKYVSEEEQEWDDGVLSPNKTWFDFVDIDGDLSDEHYLINIFNCKTTKNVNYYTAVKASTKSVLADNQKEVTISGDTPIFLDGGTDGTINNEIYEELVKEKLAEYIDPDSEVQDLAINVESIIYDSGFTLATKKELVNFITLRKDTIIVLSTHDDALGDKDLILSDARAIGVALKARYQLAPESEYYGTSVARGIVMLGTGKLRDGSSGHRIPFTYELAIKAASMMGNSSGKWDGTKVFDNYPGNALEYLIDPSPSFIPAGIKPTLWSDGLVWVQPYDRTSYHIPALQTIYDDDTSVLNNFFTIMCLSQLVKSGDRVWRKFTGTATMSNNEFLEAVVAYATEDINNKFAGILTVKVEAEITEEDENLGYSWRLYHNVYAPNMKTVLVHSSRVFRSSDLESSN